MNNAPKQNNRLTLNCSNCGGMWLPNQREKCIAKGNNCGLLNHFAKVCRKQRNGNTKPQNSKKRMVRFLEEEPHPEDSVNFLQPAKLYESDYSSGEEDNTVAVIENAVEKVEPLNMSIKMGNLNTTLLVDSGSACSILNQAVLALSGLTNKCPHNFGPFQMNQSRLRESNNPQ